MTATTASKIVQIFGAARPLPTTVMSATAIPPTTAHKIAQALGAETPIKTTVKHATAIPPTTACKIAQMFGAARQQKTNAASATLTRPMIVLKIARAHGVVLIGKAIVGALVPTTLAMTAMTAQAWPMVMPLTMTAIDAPAAQQI